MAPRPCNFFKSGPFSCSTPLAFNSPACSHLRIQGCKLSHTTLRTDVARCIHSFGLHGKEQQVRYHHRSQTRGCRARDAQGAVLTFTPYSVLGVRGLRVHGFEEAVQSIVLQLVDSMLASGQNVTRYWAASPITFTAAEVSVTDEFTSTTVGAGVCNIWRRPRAASRLRERFKAPPGFVPDSWAHWLTAVNVQACATRRRCEEFLLRSIQGRSLNWAGQPAAYGCMSCPPSRCHYHHSQSPLQERVAAWLLHRKPRPGRCTRPPLHTCRRLPAKCSRRWRTRQQHAAERMRCAPHPCKQCRGGGGFHTVGAHHTSGRRQVLLAAAAD